MTIPNTGWHIDRTLSVGSIISVITVVAAGFIWGGGLERKIEGNSLQIEHVKELNERERELDKQFREDMKNDIETINRKLDRLIERGTDKK